MYLRQLYSADIRDFQREFMATGIQIEFEHLVHELNPALTLKFGDLSENLIKQLSSILNKNDISHWIAGNCIIASFYNWISLEEVSDDSQLSETGIKPLVFQLKSGMERQRWDFNISNNIFSQDRPLLMGILNVTPDSFSDGGKYFSPQKALQHANEMARAGADIIDIGAESTRPGARAVTIEEEWQRLEAVLKMIKAHLALPVSIDTYKSEIARRALDAGADMVNDISGLTFDPEMVKVVAEAGCPLVIMHIKGTPRDMQIDPRYDNLMEELYRFFLGQIEWAQKNGISQLIVDPGIGFGKRLQDNPEIIRRLKEFRGLGYPIMVGPSRKSFIGKILDVESEKRMIGSAAAVALALNNSAKIIRVHDVYEMKQVSETVQAINRPEFFAKE